MAMLQTNGQVDGVSDYGKGGKAYCEKMGYPLFYWFRGIIWSWVASGELILIINDEKC